MVSEEFEPVAGLIAIRANRPILTRLGGTGSMRVLFVTEEPIRFSGAMVRGGQIHVRNVVAGLRDRGHDVRLVDWNPEPDRPFQHSIVPRTRFVDGPVRTFRRLLGVGRSFAPDVIVSKTRKVYLPALAATRLLQVPHVVHVGSSLESPADGLIDRLDAASFAGRLRAPHNAYFVVCDSIGNDLRARGVDSDRIHDVQNAVDATQFTPDTDVRLPSTARDLTGNTEGPLLGYVGGLVDYKGVFDLAEAVQRSKLDPTIVVVGDGPARDRLERELGDQGLFLGSVTYERMPAVYAAIDALVLPSHTEGLPRVVLEAAAAARPVVATRVGCVPQVVIDGETGLLTPPQRPAEFAAAIDNLVSKRDAPTMGAAARELVIDEYTWDAQYVRYERYLRDVVEGDRWTTRR